MHTTRATLRTDTEAELGWQIFDGHLVSVTGSNGKTTTTTLTQLMIAENAKHQVKYAGNIGISFSKVAESLGPDDTLVTELSSFQLLGAPTIHPHIAIITNIFQITWIIIRHGKIILMLS